jgi:hypothetical protein
MGALINFILFLEKFIFIDPTSKKIGTWSTLQSKHLFKPPIAK